MGEFTPKVGRVHASLKTMSSISTGSRRMGAREDLWKREHWLMHRLVTDKMHKVRLSRDISRSYRGRYDCNCNKSLIIAEQVDVSFIPSLRSSRKRESLNFLAFWTTGRVQVYSSRISSGGRTWAIKTATSSCLTFNRITRNGDNPRRWKLDGDSTGTRSQSEI